MRFQIVPFEQFVDHLMSLDMPGDILVVDEEIYDTFKLAPSELRSKVSYIQRCYNIDVVLIETIEELTQMISRFTLYDERKFVAIYGFFHGYIQSGAALDNFVTQTVDRSKKLVEGSFVDWGQYNGRFLNVLLNHFSSLQQDIYFGESKPLVDSLIPVFPISREIESDVTLDSEDFESSIEEREFEDSELPAEHEEQPPLRPYEFEKYDRMSVSSSSDNMSQAAHLDINKHHQNKWIDINFYLERWMKLPDSSQHL